ncbi:hypothetical protein AB1Y20_009671 [Prymnesium parvum]|uniref:Uncharacterized protein n=1 Tax=Prymnesium parvum TaxID=97485 RepID=A0AB34K5X3_PRYPA
MPPTTLPVFRSELAAAAATPITNEAGTSRPYTPSSCYSSCTDTADVQQVVSDGGYLHLYYNGVRREDKIPLDEGMLIQAINTCIAQHTDDTLLPMIERSSIIIKDKLNCAQVTMSSYEHCVKFATAYPEIPIYSNAKPAVLSSVDARQVNMRSLLGLDTTVATDAPIQAGPKPQEESQIKWCPPGQSITSLGVP